MRSAASWTGIARPSITCIPTIRRCSKITPPSCRCRKRWPKRVRDEFFPKSLVDPDAIKGVDGVMQEAVHLKFINAPLTQKQLDELIQIPPRKK